MSVSNKLILITNDDGIGAKGIKKLIDVAMQLGEVIVVAPASPMSGMSHAISVKDELGIATYQNGYNISQYICFGTPVDCIKIATTKILKRNPDIILSGINHGLNSAASVFYSGTMAAALEGALKGIPSIAFSLDDFSPDADFELSGKIAEKIITDIINNGLPEGIALNVNIPMTSFDKLNGIKIARQAKGYWQEKFIESKEDNEVKYYSVEGEFINLEPDATDTDEWAIKNNYVSVVPVPVDLTSYVYFNELKKRAIFNGKTF